MAHHKRRRPKSSRSGCLFCKPYKHQRAKDSFNSQPVQEQRELLLERPGTPARKSRRKGTWCRGKEGVPHRPQWIDEGYWWHDCRGVCLGYHTDWVLRCESCRKKLAWVSKWGKSRVHIEKFPGWEDFKDAPYGP